MKVLVGLFLNRLNFGDDLFKIVYEKVLKQKLNVELILVDIESTKKIDSDIDTILFGGGDMLVDFFLNPLKRIIDEHSYFQGPIYAWSVGLPYASVCDVGSLDMFDHISTRFIQDEETIQKRLGKDNVSNYPDLSTLLDWIPSDNKIPKTTIQQVQKIGISFAYDLVKNKTLFDKTTHKLFKTMKKVYKQNPKVEFIWIPFHVSLNEKTSNDKNIEKYAKEALSDQVYSQCTFIQSYLTFEEMNSLFNSLDLVICGRFHAHIISIMTHKPFLSIGQSPKVEKLLKETGLSDLSFNKQKMFKKLEWILCNYDQLFNKLKTIANQWKEQAPIQINGLKSLLESKRTRQTPPYYISPKESIKRLEMLESILSSFEDSLFEKDKQFCIDEIKKGKMNFNQAFRKDLDCKEKEEIKQFIAECISLYLTGKRDSIYYWGLSEQVMKENYKPLESIDWLFKDWFSKHFYSPNSANQNLPLTLDKPLWSIQWFEKNSFKGSHRCGWEYVVDCLQNLGEYPKRGKLPNTISDNVIILDSYCDRTFGWENQHFIALGVLPYKRPWVGFFHHTFDTRFKNNVKRSCSFPSFVQSLEKCVCLFVLSQALKNDLEKELDELKQVNKLNYIPPVFVVYHPTEIEVEQFSFDKFLENQDKKLVQIGAWLRNPYGIYRVPIEMVYDQQADKMVLSSYKNALGIRKAILKGSNMDNYFRPCEFHLLGSTEPDGIKIDFCNKYCLCDRSEDKKLRLETNQLYECEQKSFNNQFLFGFLQAVNDEYSSVSILNKLSNLEYDQLLIQNIVFLDLYDASAANTIIECIVRCTPLLVNPIPAVVEYLGKDYPFYYRSYREAGDKATDPLLIFETHKYLKNLDKSFLHIDTFITKIIQTIKSF